MTPRLRSLAACFALVALVGGGLVAPALHQAAHGLEYAHRAEAAAAQTDHVHTDDVGFTVSLDGHWPDEPCLLCVAPHAALLIGSAPAPIAADPIPAQARPIAPATAVLALLPIRGPPAVA
jgi:hypothetical protein